MESIVRDKLVEHMVNNDLFSKHQHRFVPQRDCMTNLLTCMEKWSGFMERGDSVDVIYTDFSKAFDSVPLNCYRNWRIWVSQEMFLVGYDRF